MSEYDFDIKHVTGKEKKVADALSRRSICNALTFLQSNLIEGIGKVVQRGPFSCKISQCLHVNLTKVHEGKFHLYRGNLYYLNHCVYLIPHKSQTKN